MNVIVTANEDGITIEVTEVHPVALADAFRYAVDAAVSLTARLNADG